MKSFINLSAFIVMISLMSCSAYKTGQTPDDVYFSPGKVLQPKEDVEYQEYQAYSDDQYLRMKVQDNYLWSSIDDYDYWYDSRYAFALNYYSPAFMLYGYNNYYSPYYSYYYNPYTFYDYGEWGMYNPIYVAAYYKNPAISTSAISTSASNISAYNKRTYNNGINTGYNVTNPRYSESSRSYNNTSRSYNNNYRSSNTYSTQTNSSSQSWSNPVRVSSGSTSSNTGGVSGGISNSSSGSSSHSGGRSGR